MENGGKTGAYFTVEAALVLPIVFGVILLLIYLLFFQYDRCLMEQDTGTLALRGCTLQITDKNALAQELYRQSEQVDSGKYLAWNLDRPQIALRGNRVEINGSGNLKFPFRGLFFWNGEKVWGSRVLYENQRISPVRFIRNCRKITGGR